MNIYDLTRAYYAFIVRKRNKRNCIIALKYETGLNLHTIMDALFFDGAIILDCGMKEIENYDGMIDCDKERFYDVEQSILEEIVSNKTFEHHENATCTKY